MPRSVREQLILRVAGQVFAECGYERASMDRIASRAGVSKPMLYAYFGSKEGLYVAYVERTGGELVRRLVRAGRTDPGDGAGGADRAGGAGGADRAGGADPADPADPAGGADPADGADGVDPTGGRQPGPARLRAVIGEFLAFVQEHRDGWTVLFRELNARRPLSEQVAQLRAEIVAEVRRMLESADESSSGLCPPASEGVAEAIVGAGEALANWWLKKPEVGREDITDWYVGLTRAAISAAIRRDG